MNRGRPPSEFFDHMRPRIRKEYPGKSKEYVDTIIAGIWHHRFGDKAIKKLKKQYEGFNDLAVRLYQLADLSTKEEKIAKKKVNEELHSLAKKYYDSVPVNEVADILKKHNFDAAKMDGIYTGREGKVHEQVGPNTWIVLSWYKLENSGKYEIVAYVS